MKKIKAPTKPAAVVVAGERWTTRVLRVIEKDPDGTPRKFEILYDDEQTRVDGGEEFFVVYASPALHKKPRGASA